MQRAAHERELLPHSGGRVRVRRLPGGAVPPAEETDRNAQPGGDPRRRPAQVLPPAGAPLPARLSGEDQDAGALHVLALLHRLPGHRPAEVQAGELPVEPFHRAGGGVAQVPVPVAAAQRRRRQHSLPDGPRTSPDPRPHRRSRLPGADVRRPPKVSALAAHRRRLSLLERLLLHDRHDVVARLVVRLVLLLQSVPAELLDPAVRRPLRLQLLVLLVGVLRLVVFVALLQRLQSVSVFHGVHLVVGLLVGYHAADAEDGAQIVNGRQPDRIYQVLAIINSVRVCVYSV